MAVSDYLKSAAGAVGRFLTGDSAGEYPEEIQNLVDEMKAAQQAKIEDIGKEVANKRDEAVSARKQSGIERIWEEDEEYYQGVDDANRESHPWLKSASTVGGITRAQSAPATRCSSFFNITRQFVDSAAARMGDILLPAGDWNFAIKPTPVQDEEVIAKYLEQQGVEPTQLTDEQVEQIIAVTQQKAKKKSELEEQQIRDWLVESSYHTEARKVIEQAARLGTAVFKGPFPKKQTTRSSTTDASGKTVLELVKKITPTSKAIDVWNFFPDPSCGENIHDGAYVIEREYVNAKQLKEMKSLPGYLTEQIDHVLEEGPGKCRVDGTGNRTEEGSLKESELYEVWYYHGEISVDSLRAMNVKMEQPLGDSGKTLPAVVVLVNDTPIKAHLNPLDTGAFPYDVMVWQQNANTWTGTGVSRQGRTPQDMLNAAGRALMDNAGLASGPMIIIRKGAVVPADGQWTITARKVWYALEGADIKSVNDAFVTIDIPMVTAELLKIIELAYKTMEDATGISFLLQGQQGSAPDTVGGMELLHKNASALLRRIARIYDERITEPKIRNYHDWCQMYGPEICKGGDHKIEAIGSTALVEREIQAMEALALLNLSLNPAFGLDPEKAVIEVLKAKRMNPTSWTMDEQKKKSLPAPVIPAIEVAKIRAASDKERLEAEKWEHKVTTTANLHKQQVDMDRDTLYADTMARRDQTTQEIRREELAIKRELELLKYANQRNMTLDQVKADLAKESMRLRVQKELSGVAKMAAQVATPAVEPPGRAREGHAFEE